MFWFTYEALDGEANKVTDVVLAKDNLTAISQIRNKGLFPTKVREVSEKEVQKNPDLLAAWKCNKSQMVPIETIFGTKSKQSYFQYLSELFGNKLIEWGKTLKGE